MKLDSSNDDFEKNKKGCYHILICGFVFILYQRKTKMLNHLREHKTIKFNEKCIKREASYHHLISAAAAWLAILY